jgi:hypothetical protein
MLKTRIAGAEGGLAGRPLGPLRGATEVFWSIAAGPGFASYPYCVSRPHDTRRLCLSPAIDCARHPFCLTTRRPAGGRPLADRPDLS